MIRITNVNYSTCFFNVFNIYSRMKGWREEELR